MTTTLIIKRQAHLSSLKSHRPKALATEEEHAQENPAGPPHALLLISTSMPTQS